MELISLLFLYGLRHGFDWDHIAAITSITGSQKNNSQRFLNSFLYIVGHATVILILGSVAILFSFLLPEWIDSFMEPLVGLTLIGLALVMLYEYFWNKGHTHIMSRGMLLISAFRRLYRTILRKPNVKHSHTHVELSSTSPFIIGCIHGVGAETPTQILLFLTVGQVNGKLNGLMLLLIFVTGLIVANTIVSSLSTFGYTYVNRYRFIQSLFILVFAAMSIFIGVSILLGNPVG